MKYRREFRFLSANQSSVVGTEVDNFEDREHRLNGGNSNYGGLANVSYNWSDNHWNNRSFRPLEVFKYQKGVCFQTSYSIYPLRYRIQPPIILPTLQSYLGLLKHCNSYKLKEEIKNIYVKLSSLVRY